MAVQVGVGAGLGAGIPLLLLIGGIAGYFVFRQRSRARRASIEELVNREDKLVDGETGKSILELGDDERLHELPPEYVRRQATELPGE
jgi:hypothetical protein